MNRGAEVYDVIQQIVVFVQEGDAPLTPILAPILAPITPTAPPPKSSKKHADDDDDDGTWTVDVSEAAVRARMQGTSYTL